MSSQPGTNASTKGIENKIVSHSSFQLPSLALACAMSQSISPVACRSFILASDLIVTILASVLAFFSAT